MYMCVVLVYFLTLRISIFGKKSWRTKSINVSTKPHVIKAERALTKSGNGAIGYRRKLPSVEITLPRDIHVLVALPKIPNSTFTFNKWFFALIFTLITVITETWGL